jgi:hypothetical protein
VGKFAWGQEFVAIALIFVRFIGKKGIPDGDRQWYTKMSYICLQCSQIEFQNAFRDLVRCL